MPVKLTNEQVQAVEAQHGCAYANCAGREYVIMHIGRYREILGVGSDVELQESIHSLQRAWKESNAGQLRTLRDVLDELGRKYEMPH